MKLADIILEGYNDNIQEVLFYFTERGRFVKLKIDGKEYYSKEGQQVIQDLVGMSIPDYAFPASPEIIAIEAALNQKGIETNSFEVDNS
jgi:hypothetical protein